MKMCRHGGVAQLGEHLLCKQGVIGSIPFTSTRLALAAEQEIIEEISASRCVDLFDRKIGCRSLKIHRVELALSAESTASASAFLDLAKARRRKRLEASWCTVPPATCDCVTKDIQLVKEIELGIARNTHRRMIDPVRSADVKVIGSSE